MNKIEHFLPASWLISETNGKTTKDTLNVMHQAQEEIAALRFRQAIEIKSENNPEQRIKDKRKKVLRIHGLNVLYSLVDAYRDVPRHNFTGKFVAKTEPFSSISSISKIKKKSSAIKNVSTSSQQEGEDRAEVKKFLTDNYQQFEDDELGSFKMMDVLLRVRSDIPFNERIDLIHKSLMKDYRVTDYLSNTIIGKVKRDISLLQGGKGIINLVDNVIPTKEHSNYNGISNSGIAILLLKMMKNNSDKVTYHELLLMVNIERSQAQQLQLYHGLRSQPIALWENPEYRLKKLSQMGNIMKLCRSKDEDNNKKSFLDNTILSTNRK